MGDIVATIQAEQDAIIRSELGGALVVQGGPGTGKTAVALHRAAYLLYAHRRLLERSGVLLVGPSRTFLRYIDQVLPSLGETGVVTTTVAELYPGIQATATEDEAVAELKGRALWASVVARAVRDRERVPAQPVHVRVDGHDLVIRPNDVASAIARARRNHKPHNQARISFVRDMLGRLADQYVHQLGQEVPVRRARRDRRGAAHHPRDPDRAQPRLDADHAAEARRGPLVASRTGSRPPRRSSARSSARCSCATPTRPGRPADVPLLDEAAELLGEDDQAARAEARAAADRRASELAYARQVLESTGSGGMVSAEMLADRFATTGPTLTTAERAAADRSWTYGHVVVDEAQELSAMAWRSLLRRVPTRSLTIVGDVAQTTAAAGARSWAAQLDPVLRSSWRLNELTVNYRTPAEVADTARRVAVAAHLPVSPLTSAREVPDSLLVERVGRRSRPPSPSGPRSSSPRSPTTRAPGGSPSSRWTPGSPRSRDALRAAGLRPALGHRVERGRPRRAARRAHPARGQGAGVRRRRAGRARRGARRERGRPVRRDDPAHPRAARAPRPPAAPRLAGR